MMTPPAFLCGPLGAAALAIALALAGGCRGRGGSAQPSQAPPPDVEVIEVRQADVPITNEWIGTTDGSVNAEIRARVSGYLQSQNYTDGALVKTGDMLFRDRRAVKTSGPRAMSRPGARA